MLDKAIGFGLGDALLFGGLTAAAIAAGWFLATMAAVIFLCAVLYCAAVIVEANAEAEPRPIADDVRRVKIKEGSRKIRRTFWEEGAAAGRGADPAEQAGQAKRRDATWVRKYYNGEFDPEDDEKEEEKAPLFQNDSPARLREPLRPSRVRKFVL